MSSLDDFARRPAVRRSIDGIPMAPSKVPVTPQELEQVEYEGIVHAKVFWSNNPEDMIEYEKVMQGIVDSGNMRIGRDLEQFVPEKSAWVFFIRWAEVRGHIPAHLRKLDKHFDQ